MTDPLMETLRAAPRTPGSLLRWFFGVPVRVQTYANLLYLSLAFPLGVAYFTVLVAGFVTGGALLVVLVGVVLLAAMLYLTRELAAFERWLADFLTPVDVLARTETPPDDAVEHLKHAATDLRTWTGPVYLLSKFVVGIGVLVAMSAMSLFTLAFVLVPLNYRNVRVGIFPPGGEQSLSPSLAFELQTWEVGLTVPFRLTTWYVETLPEALAVSAFGVLLAFVSLHVCNGLAWLLGWYARVLVGDSDRSELRRRLDL